MALLRPVILTLLALGPLVASPGHAAEVAEARGEVAPPPNLSSRLDGSDAARLFSGKIPTLQHVRDKYSRGYHLDVCTSKFNKLMKKNVNTVPVRASLATILANARKIGLSARKVAKALATFRANQDHLPNQRYVSVIDFDKPVTQKRLFTIDLRTGQIEGFLTSAGKGSDPDGDGYATMFSNQDKTHATSLGCYVAYGRYNGTNGDSLVLHGMESTNDNACDRSIVMHAANYVGGGAARSWGCPAVREVDRSEVFRRVSGGVICAEREGKWTTATKTFGRKTYAHRRAKHRRKKYRRHSHGYRRARHAAY